MSTDANDVSLSADQLSQLARISAAVGKPPAEVLDQLLQQFPLPAGNGIAKSRTLYEAFASDGSIGIIADGPADVSTNSKYLEGFGKS